MSIVSFLEENMLSCQWKKIGMECMGCGMQRSLIHLLKGEFIEAFYMYPAIYTLVSMFVYLGFHLKFAFKNGHKILLFLFIGNVLIMLSNYILKFIN
ncbi:DUF2752 domain-containing protein [Aureibaculum sp. 2210JD6-5]|uniref:DUF2752 domain-containing protein n=1 Tax=Aureibaculum sp. 2210JD6-5 TaxID=3103957 RepID=UPI002AADAFAB|nr:DUF2752 domain-containing protein [Aureibaculum sp. 2210JD6-5]MDY7395072.1 DUF2752 domain-containing protein [Aureibaculum sp. 2210JD6-5]